MFLLRYLQIYTTCIPSLKGWSPRFLGNLEKSITTLEKSDSCQRDIRVQKQVPKPPGRGKQERTLSGGVLFHVVDEKEGEGVACKVLPWHRGFYAMPW